MIYVEIVCFWCKADNRVTNRPEARPVHKMSRVKSMCQSSPTARVAALQELLIKQTHEAGSVMRGSTFWGPDR